MKVFDNFLPKSLQDEIEEVVNNNSSFPWYYSDEISSNDVDEHTKLDIPKWDNTNVLIPTGLTHVCCGNGQILSTHYDLIKSVMRFVELKENFYIKNFTRIRIRRTLQNSNYTINHYNLPHCDYISDEPFLTFVYYLEDSDGDTIFFDHVHEHGSKASLHKTLNIEKRVSPKKGTGILFDGHRYHAGNSPINYKKRTVINYDFTVK